MEQRILLLSGAKQSGKDTICNHIHGHIMKQTGATKEFHVNDDGKLVVHTASYDSEGKIVEGMGVLNLDNPDERFQAYASSKIWPHVKAYSFADSLKDICMRLFGLTYEQCYGTDDDKNTLTSVKWSDITFALPPRTVGKIKKDGIRDDYLTARELLQQFGTNICRKINPFCWVNDCFNQIKAEQVPLAIVRDSRFPEEIETGWKYNAKVLRLGRRPFKDGHSSETALNKWPTMKFDYYLDNKKMEIAMQNELVIDELVKWGWLDGE